MAGPRFDATFLAACAFVSVVGAAVSSRGALPAAAVLATLMGAAVLCVSVLRPTATTKIVILLVVFGSHALSLMHRFGLPAEHVRYLLGSRDVLAVLLLAALLLRRGQADGARHARTMVAVVLFPLIVVICLNLVLGEPVSTFARLVSLRTFADPLLGLLAGLLLAQDPVLRERLLRFFVIVVAIAGGYAVVEAVLPVAFTAKTIGVSDYYTDVKQVGAFLGPNGLTANAFTSSGIRRLSGTFGDPLTAGYLLAVAAVGAIALRRTRLVAICGLLAVVSFTRAGWLLLIIAALALTLSALRSAAAQQRQVVLARAAWAIVVAAVGFALISPVREYVLATAAGSDGSTLAHIEFLRLAAQYDYSLLGGGVGTAGAAVAGTDEGLLTGVAGTESTYVTLLRTIGVLGLLSYLLPWLVAVKEMKRGDGVRRSMAAALLLGIAVTSAFSEQLLTFNTGWPLGLVAGLLSGRSLASSPGTQPQRHAGVHGEAGLRAPSLAA